MFKKFCLSTLMLLLISSCTSYTKLSSEAFEYDDPMVDKVLSKALIAAGGIEKYQHLKSISYKKRSILYLPDGTIESDITQFHEYQLLPKLSAAIFWMKDGHRHSIKYDDGLGIKYVDGEMLVDSQESATKSFLSAHYVLFMPFKLTDDHVSLSYEGHEKLRSGQEVDVIKAIYQPTDFDNHSTDDTWWYYFDVQSGDYVGSMVYHAPSYAYIENTAMNEKHPLKMHTYRKSFRVDGERNIEYLRGEFFYEDYEMAFRD